MKVVFRADASMEIGSGHVMRCLTLADALCLNGAECLFVCREHEGHLADLIEERGHAVRLLATATFVGGAGVSIDEEGSRESWLGCDWQEDAKNTRTVIADFEPDWIVVDHYGIDARWERCFKDEYKIFVIDDLANRDHCCSVLLDQNLGSVDENYKGKVPGSCRVMVGPEYALLRPEFSQLRGASLLRRKDTGLKHILISMGGSDAGNITSRVLEAVRDLEFLKDTTLSIVLGAQARTVKQVNEIAKTMPCPTTVFYDIRNMAEMMVSSDLAIGAAGSTSWERCALGVPSILICLADNQKQALDNLVKAGAAVAIKSESMEKELRSAMTYFSDDLLLSQYSKNAALVTDGLGANRVVKEFYDECE